MAHEHFKDLPGRTAVDKVLRDKTFNIANIPRYHGYQIGISSTIHTLF